MEQKELINVMNQNGELLVSARDLHEGLEIKTPFTQWFDRMCEYGFDEDIDYFSFSQKSEKPSGGRPSKEYALKLDMAKEICMLQRNDMGKLFRRYFIECEKQLRNQQQPLRIETVYSYSNYWIKRELNRMKPTEIPEYVDNLLEIAKDKKPNDRLITYQVVREALKDTQPTLIEPWQREMIQASLNKVNNLIELQKTYINRTRLANKTKRINQLEEELALIEESEDDYYFIDKSGFSANYMYSYSNKGVVKSAAYHRWINNLHLEEYLPETYPEVDFNKPLRITILFGHKDTLDTNNLGKSIIDQIAEYYGFNDSLVVETVLSLHSYVDSYDEGYMYVKIENI